MIWPAGKRFAFTIVDDTDFATVRNTSAVYELLSDVGIRTTKTIWPLPADGRGVTGGDSLDDSEYRRWIQRLQGDGFEIGLHGVADGSSERTRIAEGLERFRSEIGEDPKVHSNHVGQRESVYWGADRFRGPFRWLYRGYRMSRRANPYEGVRESSPYFWGDYCRERVRYVRNMVFGDINTLKADPLMPYRDPSRPYVNFWFSSSYGARPEDFCALISEANQDRLAEEGGACIVYTHLGDHFAPVSPLFNRLIRRLAGMPGWFVPASTLLDYVGQQRGWLAIAEHRGTFEQMQWRWMADQCMRMGVQRFSALWRLPQEPASAEDREPPLQESTHTL